MWPRALLEHAAFKDKPPALYSFMAMVIRAAWKPCGIRRADGNIINLARGQVAGTIREFAETWDCPRSSVESLFKTLHRWGLIELSTTVPTRSRQGAVENSYRVTLVTICNYDQFQLGSKRRSGDSAGMSKDGLRQESPQLPLGIGDFSRQHIEDNEYIESSQATATSHLHRPPHGKVFGRLIWLNYGSDGWEPHAKDYRDVRGVELMPRSYIDGRGFWFMIEGEATRKRRYRKRA